jgi:anti-sigma factor RsiW
MSKPRSWSEHEESLLLVNAYLDNELDAADILAVERRLEADPALKAEYHRLSALKSALAGKLGSEKPSPSIRRRIAAIPGQSRFSTRSYNWRQMAAVLLVAMAMGVGGSYLGFRQASNSGELASIVSGHQRSLLAETPFDVASSDRHTIKPWFDNKLALSPRIVDLSAAGFPLTGGRIEVIGGKPVPALVYRGGKHLISVVAIPHPGARDSGAAPTRKTLDGYTVLTWEGFDFRYHAISDLAEDQLAGFVSRWREG